MVWLLVILALVIFITYKVLYGIKRYLTPDSLILEQTWTLIPIIILLTIAYPRIHLLCTQDAICTSPFYTVKIIRNQWNWQRETLDVLDHLLDRDKLDELRSYDYPFLLPLKEVSRIIVSRRDVLHSLGFPSLGVKLDSSPGRLNVTTVEASSLGLMMGSCYELCGRGHRAIPIYTLVI
jgi:heme/copper-type cytochrome/quinol oxidase subunit 2